MTNIIKNAGFMDGFFKGITERVDFKNKPFETFFSVLGPIIGGRLFGLPVGALLYGLQAVGYGPNLIGKALDDYFKKGGAKTIGEMDLSDSSLQSATSSVGSNLMNVLSKSSSDHLSDIVLIKKSFSYNDIVTATYMDKYFIKEAIGKGFISKLLKGKRLNPVNLLYSVVSMFVKGLIGLGIVGGIKGVLTDVKEEKEPKNIITDTANKLHYKNEKNNIKETIINLLNTIKFDGGNFESAFKTKYKVSLRNSPQMNNLLADIRILNKGKPLYTMNEWDIFFAPPLKDMAKELMPEFSYGARQNKISDLVKEL